MKKLTTIALASVLVGGVSTDVWAQTNYNIKIDGIEHTTSTDSSDTSEILQSKGLSTNKHDRVERDGNTINISKARPILIRDGKSAYYRFTTHLTDKDILKEHNITLGTHDKVEKSGSTLTITRVKKETRTTTKEIPFETRTVSDSSTYDDSVSEGRNGEKTVVEEITYTNGEKTSSTIINETVTKKPKTKVITKGTKPSTPTSDSSISEANPSVRLSNGNTAGTIGAGAAKEMEKRTGVSAKTWETIIARESNGRLDAYNPSGARGLFQTMPGWGPTNTLAQQLDAATRAYNAQGLSAWGF
jgi:hypothetical protein